MLSFFPHFSIEGLLYHLEGAGGGKGVGAGAGVCRRSLTHLLTAL